MKNWILGTAITFGILAGMNQAMAGEKLSLKEMMEYSVHTMPMAVVTVGMNIHCTEDDEEYANLKKVIEMGVSQFPDEKALALYKLQVKNFTKKAKADNVQSIGCETWVNKMKEFK